MQKQDPFYFLNIAPKKDSDYKFEQDDDDDYNEIEQTRKEEAELFDCIQRALTENNDDTATNPRGECQSTHPKGGCQSSDTDASTKAGYKTPPTHSQFKTGCKGGPGRPKGAKSTTTIIKQAIEQQAEQYGEAVIQTLFMEARIGRIQAIKLVLSMIMPKTKVRLSTKNGKIPVFPVFSNALNPVLQRDESSNPSNDKRPDFSRQQVPYTSASRQNEKSREYEAINDP